MNDVVTGVEFSASLQLERAAAEAFLGILQTEQDALVQGDSERLEVLAQDKTEMVRQLLRLAEQRNQYLVSRALTPDREGMEAWLAASPDKKAAAVAWHDLLQLAQAARQLNYINGQVIAARLQHNQQTFAALQGAAGHPSLYNPHGQTFSVSGGRQLARG